MEHIITDSVNWSLVYTTVTSLFVTLFRLSSLGDYFCSQGADVGL